MNRGIYFNYYYYYFFLLKAPGAVFSQMRECDDLKHEKLTPPAFCLAALSVSMVSITVHI